MSFTTPTDGTSYTAPATINLAASVTTNGNTINKVQFYSNATNLLSEATASPYAYSWAGVSAGSYSLIARVVFNSTGTVDSTAAVVTVTNPPVAGSAVFTSYSLGADGSMSMSGTGAADQAYVLLSASNLSRQSPGQPSRPTPLIPTAGSTSPTTRRQTTSEILPGSGALSRKPLHSCPTRLPQKGDGPPGSNLVV